MSILRAPIVLFASMALLSSPASPQPKVEFCELMRHPEKYDGTQVKVRATWIYGFERSYLHCLGCDGRVWLDTSDLDDNSEKTIKHASKGAGIANADVEGVFEVGSFGHLNGYKYQLKAHAIANPAVLSQGMKTPDQESEVERQFSCGGANPR